MPDIKLDFSRVTYSTVLEIIAPILPGGIFAVGTLVLNPALAAKLLSNPYLGYRARLAAAIFVAYSAGLLLNLLVNWMSYWLGYTIGYVWGSKLFPNPPTPWKNLHWRKMARRFLGPELAPATDDLYFEEMHKQQLNEANAIQDEELKQRQLKFLQEFFEPKHVAELDWYWWYQILSKYFTEPSVWAAPWQYYLSMLHTASWAVILLMFFNHSNYWFAWTLCIPSILFCNAANIFWGGVWSDPYAIDQTAKLFRALRPLAEPDTIVEKK